MMRHPLACRFVGGIRSMDIARWRDERLCKVSPATVKRDLVLLGHVFEVARKAWAIYMHNPVRDIRLPPSLADCKFSFFLLVIESGVVEQVALRRGPFRRALCLGENHERRHGVRCWERTPHEISSG
jgi:hypothetical protein